MKERNVYISTVLNIPYYTILCSKKEEKYIFKGRKERASSLLNSLVVV